METPLPEKMLRNDPVLENTGAEAFALVEQRRRRRTRRRLGLWGAFLLVGLLLGTIYATGFATTGGTNSVPEPADPLTNTRADNEDRSGLDGLVTQPTANLTYNWFGRWGDIDSAVLYELDLSDETGNFFAEVLLTDPQPAGFSDLQMQFRIADDDGGDGCDTTDLNDTNSDPLDYRVMVFEQDDAQVTFSGLLGGTGGLPVGDRYCIGVFDYTGPPDSGKDTGGTFLRRSSASAVPNPYPTFIGTLNRM